ncbi:MAG: amidohydrolase family protein, partial [Clostridia bacterium]|nr:amidohydrolase family protein [Clostridia bacterium]
FFENALGLVYSAMPAPDRDALRRMLLKGCKRLNSYGITSCQSDDYESVSGLTYLPIMEVMEEMAENGELTVRVNEQVHFTNVEDLSAFIEAGHHKRGTVHFKNGPLKMLGDGSLGARTAYLSRPYADDETTRGIPVYTQKQFDEMCDLANRNGMPIAIHSIGDGILDCILDAYDKALAACPREDHRHGIVHCQITRPDQLKRIKDMGLHVYLQSIFIDYDSRIVHARVGEELAATSYGAKSFLENSVSFSNGSDAPVEDPVVLRGIQCAVTRRSIGSTDAPYRPEEALTVGEAIDSFTKGAAYASFEEHIKGRIQPGMLADFVILGEDPFTADPETLHKIPVAATYLGGEKVY